MDVKNDRRLPVDLSLKHKGAFIVSDPTKSMAGNISISDRKSERGQTRGLRSFRGLGTRDFVRVCMKQSISL